MPEMDDGYAHLSPDEERLVQAFAVEEVGEPTTVWEALCDRDWKPMHPSKVLDYEAAVRRLVNDLAWIHVYLRCTEHLSDTELYEELYELIREYEKPIWPEDSESAITLHFALHDLDEGEAWLRYYASDHDRRIWAKRHPE